MAVKDGVVTLAGELSSLPEKWAARSAALRVAGVQALVDALREAAVHSVGHLAGVLGVDDQITLEPGPADSGLRHLIEAALARVAKVDASRSPRA